LDFNFFKDERKEVLSLYLMTERELVVFEVAIEKFGAELQHVRTFRSETLGLRGDSFASFTSVENTVIAMTKASHEILIYQIGRFDSSLTLCRRIQADAQSYPVIVRAERAA